MRNSSITCLYFNARSLVQKMDYFRATVEAFSPDIIGITESWASSDISDSEISLSGYDMFRRDRPVDVRGGGVLLYVRSELNAVEFVPKSRFPEQVWCSVKSGNRSDMLIGVCYRSPNMMTLFGNDTNGTLLDLVKEVGGRQILWMGDFNYPDIDWNTLHASTTAGQCFVDCIEDEFLVQHVKEATRGKAVLDLVITSEPDMVDTVEVLDTFGSSDHSILRWSTNISMDSSESKQEIRDYLHADYDSIRQELSSVDWEQSLSGTANECWEFFREQLERAVQEHVPIKKVSVSKKKKAPWLTYRAVKMIKKKHKIYSKYKDKKHPAYVAAAAKADCEVRKAKLNFEEKLAKNIKNDAKSFFAYARHSSRTATKVGPIIKDNGDVISVTQDITEELNDFFSSVFTREDTSRTPQVVNVFQGAPSEELNELHITPAEVDRLLGKLRDDKAAGADNILPKLLREVREEIAYPVSCIFRKSLQEGVIPDDWKVANVSPIFKKGSRSQVSNYRPISLTSQLCKILESLLRDSIVQHLEKHCLIFQSQHGFRKGGSCMSNLLAFLDRISHCVENGDNVDVIYLDFAKAFDKVPHHRLKLKLRAHGISGKILNWIQEWLFNRKQRVCLRGYTSSWQLVLSGIPQGSVLGPLLFLIYINDIDKGILNWLLKFADDTKVFGVVNNSGDSQRLQQDLSKLFKWSHDWQMLFNIEKCKVLHIGSDNQHFSYHMDGCELEKCTEEKDLGVIITNDMKSSRQCLQAYNRASRILGMIRRTISYKNKDIMLNLYKTLVRPHLEFCTPVWSPHYKKDKILLERVQRRFTRMIPELKNMEYESRLNKLGLWSLEERRNRADLIEVFKMYAGLSILKFDSLFEVSNNSHTRGHSLKLAKHRCRLDLRKFFFAERVIDRWNSLDQQAVSSSSLNSFKSALTRTRRAKMGFFVDHSD